MNKVAAIRFKLNTLNIGDQRVVEIDAFCTLLDRRNSVPFANSGGVGTGRTGIQINNFALAFRNGKIVEVLALHGFQGMGVIVVVGGVLFILLLFVFTRAGALLLTLRLVFLVILRFARFCLPFALLDCRVRVSLR
uniref:Uncharacterized protein n=1 Tax=Plectus sambesii TaxID=2011161 RepID=A0A914UNY4_9BILA